MVSDTPRVAVIYPRGGWGWGGEAKFRVNPLKETNLGVAFLCPHPPPKGKALQKYDGVFSIVTLFFTKEG